MLGQRQTTRRLIAFTVGAALSASFLGLCIYGVITRYFIKPDLSEAHFRLPPGQHIYLVARDDWTDNWTYAEDDDDEAPEHISTDGRAEKLAREEFVKKGRVSITNNELEANFIFLLVVDPKSRKESILGEVITPECYKDAKAPFEHCDSRWTGWGNSPAQVVQAFYKDVLP